MPQPDPSEITLPAPTSFVAQVPRRRLRVGDVGGASARGPSRPSNDDAWAHERARIFVVADGMGGRPRGDLAARVVVDTLIEVLSQPTTRWHQAVLDTNRAVIDRGHAVGVDRTGAVAVALRIDDGGATLVHLGDARAYRLRAGTAQQLTRDHSVRRLIADLGVHRAESHLSPRRLRALTGYFGDVASADSATVHAIDVRPGDRFVLCSDGVHATIDIRDWRDAAAIESAGDAAALLVERALAAGGTDDATAVVVDVDVDVET